MEKLQWQLELLDKVSGPAARASTALTRLNGRLSGLGGSASRGIGGASRGIESMATRLNSVVQVGRVVAEVFAGIAREVYNLGRQLVGLVLQEAAFHQSTMTTFATLLRGERGGAGREFAASLRLANMLPGETNQFTAQRRDLITSGFTGRRDRDAAFAMIQDMAALRPDDSTIGSRLSTVLGQIRGQDRINGGDLLQLGNAGIGRADLARAVLANRTGRGMETFTSAQVRTTLAQLSRGTIGANEGIRGIARVVTHLTGQRLGGFALSQGNSLSGQISNLQSSGQTILQRMFLRNGGFERMPGGRAFTAFLHQVNDMLTGDTSQARRFGAVLERLINGVFGAFGQINPAAIFDTLLDVLERVVPMVTRAINSVLEFAGAFGRAVAPAMTRFFEQLGMASSGSSKFGNDAKTMGAALGQIASALIWVVGWVARFWGAIAGPAADTAGLLVRFWAALVGAAQTVYAWFAAIDWSQLGTSIAQGIVNGLVGGARYVGQAAYSLAATALDAITNPLEIHSPSRVMERLGGYVAEGFAVGIDGGAPRAAASMSGLLNGAATATGMGAGRASGPVSLTMTFQLPESAARDPEAFAEAVRPLVMTAVTDAFRDVGTELGVE